MLKQILLTKTLPVVRVDPDDVSVEYSVDRDVKRPLEDVSVTIYPARIDNRDVFYIDLTFAAIDLSLSDEGNKGFEANSRQIYFEARFAPELFKDLRDGALLLDHTEPLSFQDFARPPRSLVGAPPTSVDMSVLSFRTIVNGKRVLDHKDGVPKFFFADGEIPIIAQIN